MSKLFINWQSSQDVQLKVDRAQSGQGTTDLTLVATEAALLSLRDGLVNLSVGKEFKLHLPQFINDPLPVREDWLLYIKETAGSDRAMAAHPSEHEWVASVLLTRHKLTWLCSQLEKLASKILDSNQFHTEEQGRLGYPSNLKIIFELKA